MVQAAFRFCLLLDREEVIPMIQLVRSYLQNQSKKSETLLDQHDSTDSRKHETILHIIWAAKYQTHQPEKALQKILSMQLTVNKIAQFDLVTKKCNAEGDIAEGSGH
jgi:hypothetical protein